MKYLAGIVLVLLLIAIGGYFWNQPEQSERAPTPSVGVATADAKLLDPRKTSRVHYAISGELARNQAGEHVAVFEQLLPILIDQLTSKRSSTQEGAAKILDQALQITLLEKWKTQRRNEPPMDTAMYQPVSLAVYASLPAITQRVLSVVETTKNTTVVEYLAQWSARLDRSQAGVERLMSKLSDGRYPHRRRVLISALDDVIWESEDIDEITKRSAIEIFRNELRTRGDSGVYHTTIAALKRHGQALPAILERLQIGDDTGSMLGYLFRDLREVALPSDARRIREVGLQVSNAATKAQLSEIATELEIFCKDCEEKVEPDAL